MSFLPLAYMDLQYSIRVVFVEPNKSDLYKGDETIHVNDFLPSGSFNDSIVLKKSDPIPIPF